MVLNVLYVTNIHFYEINSNKILYTYIKINLMKNIIKLELQIENGYFLIQKNKLLKKNLFFLIF
jgi:hypothetical protein